MKSTKSLVGLICRHRNPSCQGARQHLLSRAFSSSPPSGDDATTNTPPVNFASEHKGPIVNQLWTSRLEAKRKAAAVSETIDMDRLRSPSESMTEITYAFSTDEFLKERYRNPFGHLRFGKVLEDLDALAGNIAFSHVQDPAVNIVTASVDRIRLTGMPNLSFDQCLSGKVTYVGTSSMEIRMQCKDVGIADGEQDPWMEIGRAHV